MKLIALVVAGAFAACAQSAADRKEWVPIFNGKNLDGWTVKLAHHEVGDNFGDTFRVENGVIKVAYDKYPEFGTRFGHLFWKEKLSHYVVRVEYRFVGEQMKDGPPYAKLNSGIMIHSQAPETILKEQDWPISVEAQFIGNGATGSRPTLNVCTPGTEIFQKGEMVKAHCTNSTSKAYHNDEWVAIEVEVKGAESVRHIDLSERTIDEEDDLRRLRNGSLLQSPPESNRNRPPDGAVSRRRENGPRWCASKRRPLTDGQRKPAG